MAISRIFYPGNQQRLESKLFGWTVPGLRNLTAKIEAVRDPHLISLPHGGGRVPLNQITDELELCVLLRRNEMTHYGILFRFFTVLEGTGRKLPREGIKLEEAYSRMIPQFATDSQAEEHQGNICAERGRFGEAANQYFWAARKALRPDDAKRLWLLAADNHVKAGGTEEYRKAALAYCNAAKLSAGDDRILYGTLAADNYSAGGQTREAGYAREAAARQALRFNDEAHDRQAQELLEQACGDFGRVGNQKGIACCREILSGLLPRK
jgi:hypothetical protein